jgi:hypothetical protein
MKKETRNVLRLGEHAIEIENPVPLMHTIVRIIFWVSVIVFFSIACLCWTFAAILEYTKVIEPIGVWHIIFLISITTGVLGGVIGLWLDDKFDKKESVASPHANISILD